MKELSDDMLRNLRAAIAHPDLTGTKYRMIRPIASGGMGEVYLVEDISLERRVALKVGATAMFSEQLARRMLREARIVAWLEHPSIVPVHDVGMLPDGRPFFTMKYVEGESLHHHIRKAPPLPELLRMFHKICEAVAFAHAHDVIHRDLKPENIMVGPFGEVLVMDWGIAKVLGDLRLPIDDSKTGGIYDCRLTIDDSKTQEIDGVRLEERNREGDEEGGPPAVGILHDSGHGLVNTAQGAVLGTPPYMSPEQAGGDANRIDKRTDIYALGAILYFLLVGRPPREEAPRDHDSPPSPRQLNRTIPRQVDAICMKAIAPDPDHRYAGAGDMGLDVIRFLDGLPVSAYRENPLEKAARWASRHRFVLLLIVAYLIMRLVVFLVTSR